LGIDFIICFTCVVIGQGNDPLTKVIGQGAQAAIELSYEHFPKATEKTLDLIAQVGNGLDVTVKYIDNKTGNVVSAQWNELDKATQDQIKGASKIVSVVVPAGSVRAIGKLKQLKNRNSLINGLENNGIKVTSENIVDIQKLQSGRTVWLETGNLNAGLKHIVNEHAGDFARKGIPENRISAYIMTALKKGKIVGYQGKGTGRPIYEFTYNNKPQKIAVTIGKNGFHTHTPINSSFVLGILR
jgi:hypothetical protein